MNNKKLIRLTEADLHRIVRESVNNVLNEIGDTHLGQYQLGRTYARAKRNGKGDIANRAALSAIDNGHEVGQSAFLRGQHDQDRHMDAVNIFPEYENGEDETMNYSIEKYRNLDNERKRELRGF